MMREARQHLSTYFFFQVSDIFSAIAVQCASLRLIGNRVQDTRLQGGELICIDYDGQKAAERYLQLMAAIAFCGPPWA